MATDKTDKAMVRRDVLKAIGLGAAGAAAAAPFVVAGTAVAKESAEERVKARYQETDHVKAYYRTNRY